MDELALFAGAGGGLLGSRLLGWRTVCAVELNPYRQAVLLARQEDGQLDPFPIWSDVRDFDGRPWCGIVDVITAGFPCQPFSQFGDRQGETSSKNMWPDTIRVLREVGPRFALLENVPGLLVCPYFGTILGDLAESGYRVRWDCIPASAVGSPHIRDRLWVVAHPNDNGESKRDAPEPRSKSLPQWDYSYGLDTAKQRAREALPTLRGMANGVAARVDRLAALGDGQVPAVVRAAWLLLGPQPSGE